MFPKKRKPSDDTLCPPRPDLNAVPNPHQRAPRGEDIKSSPPQPASLRLLCKRRKIEDERRVHRCFEKVEKEKEDGQHDPGQPVSVTPSCQAEVAGSFTPAMSDNLILGPYHGPRNKPCRCRPGRCHAGCRTQQSIDRRNWPVPREPLIVKNKTFKFLLEDVLGTAHASELQPVDALADGPVPRYLSTRTKMQQETS